jgi:pimeloyl-ACP methyl ester carboxylesterase
LTTSATLTGLGERVHLGRPETDLETHIADVVNLVEYEDLDGIVLVGHSYSGIVVTGVADRIAGRLAALVFVDSAPFEDGEAYLDISPPEVNEALRRQVDERGEGWRLPFPAIDELGKGASLAGLDEAAFRLMRAKAVGQPFGTYRQPLRLQNAGAGDHERVIVACDDLRTLLAAGIPRFQAFAPPTWRIEELATGHWPMLSAPAELAAVLDRVATGSAGPGR